jgi:membrane protein implicated in regulation of membrane protease activity
VIAWLLWITGILTLTAVMLWFGRRLIDRTHRPPDEIRKDPP